MGQFITTPPLAVPNQPRGKLSLSANQSIAFGGGAVILQLNKIGANFSDGIEDTVNYRILPGVAGWYLFTASIIWESGQANTKYDLIVTKSGINCGNNEQVCVLTGGTGAHFTEKITDVIYLTAVNWLDLRCANYHGSINATALYGGSPSAEFHTFLTVQRIL